MAKRKSIEQLEAELARVSKNSVDNYELYRTATARATVAEDALKESRSHFADLKERLANAEGETSRLRGYLARVHEDDIVRDGLVEIEDVNGKRSVPRRPPPLQETHFPTSAGNFEYDTFGQKKKRTHWTSY